MDLRGSYKQSEVGVIPEDWDVRLLSQELDGLEAGVSVNSIDEQIQAAPHDVFILKTSAVANGAFITSEVKKVAPRDLSRVRTHARADTIILSRMNTPDLVGESGYVDRDYPNFFLPDRLWMTRFKRESKICVKWLGYLLNTQKYKTIVKSAATGTSGTMKNISKGAFTAILLPWPTPEEQRAIAAALSDADALIASLDALIAKKLDLKQAAMQQLLTGKTRLPGFKCEWEVKRLGQLCSMKSGEGITAKNIDDSSPFPCFGGNGLRGFTSRFTHDGRYCLIGRVGALCGNLLEVSGQFFASEHAIVVTAFEETDVSWLTRALSTLSLNRRAESSAQPVLTVSKLLLLELQSPPTKDEQAAIASVLADMDVELIALEAKRDKARALKQGMMQELLTGRIRLK